MAKASLIVKDGKTLTAEIKAVGKGLREFEKRLHIVACSAVWLASKDGRCNWLNELFAELSQANRDYLRAWLSPTAKFNEQPLFVSTTWLKFTKDATGNWFSIVPNTEKLRPDWIVDEATGKASFVEDGIIGAVAGDFDRSFVHKTAQATANTLAGLDDQIKSRFGGTERFLKKLIEENPGSKDVMTPALEALQGAAIIAQQAAFAYMHPKQAAAKAA